MNTVTDNVKTAALIGLALVIGALGLRVAEVDDPNLTGFGAAGLGLLLMIGAVLLAVRAARNRLSARAARPLLAVGVVLAALAAFVAHTAALTAPLFAQPPDVPSVIDSAPAPQHSGAVERARVVVRQAVIEGNLPGVSVAVGAGGAIVWAEGFGWRDVDTRTPVTPKTRFNIGTAAPLVAAAVAPLALKDSGSEAATEWSPGHIGEPEDDFPPFTMIRHVIFRPLGLAPSQPLPGERATFYMPRSDDSPLSGRQLMYLRDLACCAGRMASYSTASDLVRVGLANGGSVNGELAGGMVMSLMTLRDNAVVVAVLSNMAHANTSALAAKIGAAFPTEAR
jgi:hypothetical protein